MDGRKNDPGHKCIFIKMEEITFLAIKLKLNSAFLSIGPSVWRLSKVRLIYKEFYAVFIANDAILCLWQ